jgi:antitoxin Phd
VKTTWKLQDAKSQFSKLVDEALHHGPQWVTRRGKDAVVIVSVKEYRDLTSHKPTFKEFLLDCPTLDEPLDIDRSKELPRSIAL